MASGPSPSGRGLRVNEWLVAGEPPARNLCWRPNACPTGRPARRQNERGMRPACGRQAPTGQWGSRRGGVGWPGGGFGDGSSEGCSPANCRGRLRFVYDGRSPTVVKIWGRRRGAVGVHVLEPADRLLRYRSTSRHVCIVSIRNFCEASRYAFCSRSKKFSRTDSLDMDERLARGERDC